MNKLALAVSGAGLGVLCGLWIYNKSRNKCKTLISINPDKISVIIQESPTQFKIRHGGVRAVTVCGDINQTIINKLTPGMISVELDNTNKIYINCKQIVMLLRYSPTELHLITGENTHQPIRFYESDAVSNCQKAAEKISKEMDIQYF